MFQKLCSSTVVFDDRWHSWVSWLLNVHSKFLEKNQLFSENFAASVFYAVIKLNYTCAAVKPLKVANKDFNVPVLFKQTNLVNL